MNGELHQICMLVNAARNALATASPIQAILDNFVDSISFVFTDHTADTVEEWFSRCVGQGMTDVKMLCPLEVGDRGCLGFSNNAGRACIVVFYPDSRVSYWTAHWEFLPDRKKWKVAYQENVWADAPKTKMIFENNTEQFDKVLGEIEEFADRIGFSGFRDIFHSARKILNGSKPILEKYPTGHMVILPQVTEENKRLFFAASQADVFGAMGSWNDSPPFKSREMGLEDEYDRLSEELLRQLRLAVLYVINESPTSEDVGLSQSPISEKCPKGKLLHLLFGRKTDRGTVSTSSRKKVSGGTQAQSYDPATQRPVLRCSICTGEQVAGFKDIRTGKFEEVTLIRDERELREFMETYGIEKVTKEY